MQREFHSVNSGKMENTQVLSSVTLAHTPAMAADLLVSVAVSESGKSHKCDQI